MKKILILGATGDVGNAAANALLQAGHRVIAVSRGGAKADALRERHKNNEAYRLVRTPYSAGSATNTAGMGLCQTPGHDP